MSSRILAGRYELLEKIGEGGMAVVYKARCRLLNRYVAIKILKPEFTKDLKFIESFRRESQSAASLSHPNIVNIYDVGKEGNIYYIVMELIEGQVLSDLIKKEGPMEYHKAVEVTKQIALALSFAHKNHIIHRDVKPDNILITREGTAKITDFGIAKAVNTGTIVGNTGTVMGSVHYFSPEQARGGYVDEKSDIYSLGIVLYELLTGRVPFDAENPVAVALMHMNDDMVPPSQYVAQLPADLENIIMKATNKYQINRFKTADEMYHALSNMNYHLTAGPGNGTKQTFDATRVMAAVNGTTGTVQKENTEELIGDMRKKNKKENKPKKRVKINKVKVAAIILALLFAIPASHFILTAVEGIGAAKEVTVPDVTGMTVEEATDELAKLNLKCEVRDEVSSKEFDAGEIVSQDPVAEMTVKEGFTIYVNVSKGVAARGTIPNVVNRTSSDAKFMIESYGFTVGDIKTENSDLPKDIVIRQTPAGETEAAPGTVVDLVVSLGKAIEQVPMPNLMGMDVDAARTELEKKGLSLGAVGYEMSTAYAQNTVMWQQNEPGTLIEVGTKVNIKVSTGDQPAGSKAIPLTLDFGRANNEVFYLTVVISDESGVRTIINREQKFKSDGSEVLSLSGDGAGTVKVIFDNDVVMEKSVDFNTGVLN
ncbi:Stk1 family PASTA domain-containing Ser/Thr kinase [Sinanaerobacter chloroacetimidivorans]|uniref:non-specific serine/threonine protein kinase n=1 Tax=Sinanaerobacter chloroacetimidivorans TaxID=2818044 RepID=A0A8J8B2U9_9FIRM|nr:Stk1 family PASTA domain-containing Ser/Thr kinase [Sinanaerobacter chloroacetimidivorans]MBR0600218.1 Stk1 family PASTA domain-containing Ser/Thr kinase [Sinanaerobacter chloroacetimidivorans]